MKLLVVDHNALEPANRILYQKIVDIGGVELRLVVPSKWFNNFKTLHYTPPSESLNYEIFASDVLFSARTHRLVYLSLSKHLKHFQPEIFYINAEPENFQTFQAALLNPSHKTKLIFSSWRNIDHVKTGYPYRLSVLHRDIEAFVLKRATHGVVFNHSAKNIFAKNGFRNTTVIPPPVDTQLFEPRIVDRQRDAFVVGYVGRLVRAKGVDLILQALRSLPRVCTAMIVGDGEAKDDLKKLAAELDIVERVNFTDAVSHESLPDIFAQMDVVALPSRTTHHWREQFGRVLVEAMACGVPVIGSTSGEIPNVIADAGFVFKEENIDGLRLGVERLYSSEKMRSELRERGIHRARTVFSLEVVAAQYHKLFTSLS